MGRGSEDYIFSVRQFMLYKDTEYQTVNAFSGEGVVATGDVLYDEDLYDTMLFDVDGGFTNVVLDFIKTAYITMPVNKIKFKFEGIRSNSYFSLQGIEARGFFGEIRPT